MGLNLLRWLREPQYRAVKRWKRHCGDTTLRLDFPLDENSRVWDVGGYDGQYALALSQRYGSHIDVFEPHPTFALACQELLADRDQVHVHPIGLSNRDGKIELSDEGLGSSMYRNSNKAVQSEIRDVSEVYRALNGSKIDLMKLNVEGAEYDILPRLIDAGLINNIDRILVQFHLFSENHKHLYEKISHQLSKTHSKAWRYPFIWELWELK